MWQSVEVRFAEDHPTAAGHFPSNPIIPGALLLDEVVQAVAGKAEGGARIVIRAAKFLQPVRPGDAVHVQWQSLAGGAVRFECRLAGQGQGDDQGGLAAAGTLDIGPVP